VSLPPALDSARAAPGSFRDPQGQVLEHGERIYRALIAPLAPFPATWADPGPLSEFVAAGKLWPARPVSRDQVPAEVLARAPAAVGFLEHPRLATITFPFEWPFELLKRAALLHLDFHRELLKRGLTLSDGYAYNVQFVGTRPVFLDALAIVPYVEGQPWAGYAQYCESFLNPLLLAARGCDSWQSMYRGRMRGISTRETARQLGVWGALRAGAFVHVILNSQSEGRAGTATSGKVPKVSKAGLDLLLASLAGCIRKLSPPATRAANWGGYEGDNSYSNEQRAAKHAAVTEFVQRTRPRLLVDVGCNAGEYSATALEAGAAGVVGLERDAPAVNRAVARGDAFAGRFLPLQIDIQNTSPALGWDLAERQALRDRLKPDALLCLALIHHLVLAEGLPLALALPGIVSLAPRGIIEFVPPEDPMARRIAGPASRLRHPYDLATFLSTLAQTATVTRQIILAEHGRVLVEYQR
jgi:ribosomal protein L11 methylase PrmA